MVRRTKLAFTLVAAALQVGRSASLQAQEIVDPFDQYVQLCREYAQTQQWDDALRNCDQALELDPNAIGPRYQRARILFELDRYPEALTELEQVLELDPFHEDALQLAGHISAKESQDDKARDYYSRYLELNPSGASVRMKIASDLAQAGDPVGAMQLIREGLDVDAEDLDLWEQYGGFASTAALEIQRESAGAEAGGGVAPEAVEYYRRAIEAYQKVYSARGADTPVGHLHNIIAAYIQLDELDEAVTMAQRAVESHPHDDAIWSYYADALQRQGKLDDAIAALDRVKEINPSHPSASLRQGNWLIQAGRVEDAVRILSNAASQDPQQAETGARLIFQDAYANGVQKNRYDYAATNIAAAKQLPNLSAGMKNQLNFWQGYSLFQSAVAQQKPNTLETARATLPRFQQALELLQQSGDYAKSVNVPLDQLLGNANTYIEIQEAIIRRGH